MCVCFFVQIYVRGHIDTHRQTSSLSHTQRQRICSIPLTTAVVAYDTESFKYGEPIIVYMGPGQILAQIR